MLNGFPKCFWKRKDRNDMKMIGLIGGMSWESTVTYYQLINEAVKKTGRVAFSKDSSL